MIIGKVAANEIKWFFKSVERSLTADKLSCLEEFHFSSDMEVITENQWY